MKRNLVVVGMAVSLALFSTITWGQPAQVPLVKKSPVDNPQRVLFVGSSIMY